MSEFRRSDDIASREVLIAAGLGLAVPQLLVFDFDRGEFRDDLEAEDTVPEIGDRGVAVVEVEAIEELLGTVSANPFQAVEDGIGGAAVSGQRVGSQRTTRVTV